MLNDATEDAAKRLDALIPEEWTTLAAQDYEAELNDWKREGEQFEGTVEELNGRQAALSEKLRTQHGKLLEGSGAARMERRLREFKQLKLSESFGEALEKAQRTEQAVVEALKAEAPVRAWQRRPPLKGMARGGTTTAHSWRSPGRAGSTAPTRSSSRRCVPTLPRPPRTGSRR
ncbi:hypothetical protein ACFWB2_43805 [Streptomyces virginiae]|uniref:hypothetical protein n=1 Tax=Streptomyces virginiae TaxID=1961 RepID=UPI0036CBC7D0